MLFSAKLLRFGKRNIKHISMTLVRLFYGAGSMDKYFEVKKKYDGLDRQIMADNSLSDEKKKYLHKKYQNKIRKYAALVTPQSWAQEKEKENKILQEAILGEKCFFPKEYAREVDYCKAAGKLLLYPYAFTERYLIEQDSINVYSEKAEDSALKYVLHRGKKLYFPGWNDDNSIRHQYTQLVMEQDSCSPHKYFDRGYIFPRGGIFVDVGSAEGIISLDVVSEASEVYLIERSESWAEALSATFKNYENKVHIIRAYAGLDNDANTVCLDSILAKYRGREIFIKMDIEGMELEALAGCKSAMALNDCTFACACYHTNTMEKELISFFTENGYVAQVSGGYMLFYYGHMTLENGMYEKMEFPYFRRGLVRACKHKE